MITLVNIPWGFIYYVSSMVPAEHSAHLTLFCSPHFRDEQQRPWKMKWRGWDWNSGFRHMPNLRAHCTSDSQAPYLPHPLASPAPARHSPSLLSRGIVCVAPYLSILVNELPVAVPLLLIKEKPWHTSFPSGTFPNQGWPGFLADVPAWSVIS